MASRAAPKTNTAQSGVEMSHTRRFHATTIAQGVGRASLRSLAVLCEAYADITGLRIKVESALHCACLWNHCNALMADAALMRCTSRSYCLQDAFTDAR